MFKVIAILLFSANVYANPVAANDDTKATATATKVKTRAKQTYEDGKVLFHNGRFSEAYLKFVDGEAILATVNVVEPALIWNEAQCLAKMNDYDQAAFKYAAYRRLVKRNSDEDFIAYGKIQEMYGFIHRVWSKEVDDFEKTHPLKSWDEAISGAVANATTTP